MEPVILSERLAQGVISEEVMAELEVAEGDGTVESPIIPDVVVIPEENKIILLAEWDTAYQNDLPDDAFAFIRPGGEKDETGKTKPRNLRYLPYKNKEGKVDLPHLRNALTRLPQTDLTPEEKAKARKALVSAAKEADIGEYTEMVEAVELREVLGLNDNGDVMAAVKKLKETPPATITLSEHQIIKAQLEADVKAAIIQRDNLTQQIKLRDRDDVVKAAILGGKILPAQKNWADDYALRDPEGFGKFVETAPVAVKLGSEIGGSKEPPVGLTPTECEIAKKLGIPEGELIKTKSKK